MSIVVTGATGHLGRQVIEQLLARGATASDILAGGRNPAALQDLADLGVRTARIDYEDPATLDAAFADAEKILLISGSEVGRRVPQHAAVIDAAGKVDATLVYTSAPGASTSALVLAPEHKATEELLDASGLTHTVLRNSWYTENYDETIQQGITTGALLTSTGDGRIASAPRRDYAEAAAVVLLSEEHNGAVLELSGDHPWNFEELAATITEVSGREVRVDQLSTEDHLAALLSFGLDEGTAGFVTALDANIRDGLLAGADGTLSRLLGRPTTTLHQHVRTLLAE
ncbi:SDR family oxidoreductase [Nesterenkonia jeotgali]|uniref:NAD(P)-dependent oxidoreductase n=1 Tax=Nesterenkonia jeotgali TaxID=317018 RepID=A0A0W8IHV7_9MICC|nr:SDR family oxidoreductase [Nesterenkonia jeotgali]KUG59548.1 NAD(P)-dependent oxidoreductase [Nesterenkonia jeotgali]MBA8922237.1 NAD(P)H dehydrogenase (quinone) [Nesterenkonia jeotgali]